MKLKKVILYIILINLFYSCMSDIDFDQSQHIELNPVAKVSVLRFNLKQPDFVNLNTTVETPVRLDFTNINIFNNDVAAHDIDRAIFKFEIDNKFNKKFRIDYYLMDVENNILEILPFNIDENTTLKTNIEYLRGTTQYDNLIQTERINVVVTMVSNANITDIDMYLQFKSAIDIYLTIGND